MGVYDQYSDLTEAEQDFVKRHPFAAWSFSKAAGKADKESRVRFPGPGRHNGRGDAFRHCYWNALMVKAEDEKLAKEFADLHEDRAGQPARERTMDLHNNEVGRGVGLIHRRSADKVIADSCEAALNAGQLVYY